jgi:hypothetical protein
MEAEDYQCLCGCKEYRPVHVVGGLNERKCEDCGAVQKQGW